MFWPKKEVEKEQFGQKPGSTAAGTLLGRLDWGPGASQWSMDDRSSVMSDWQRVLD
jgi:hypothetical protein